MNKSSSLQLEPVPLIPALHPLPQRSYTKSHTLPDHSRYGGRPGSRENLARRERSAPRDRPGNRSDTGPNGSTRPPGQLIPLPPLAPVRVIRVGEPGLDHPLRPVTEPVPATAGDPTDVAATVVRAAVEVLDGRRSLSQIRGWLTPQVALQLAERTRLELAVPTRDAAGGPIRIRKVHLVRFGDRAEATVLIDMSDRTRAAAARLEARNGAWRVSVLEIA